MAGNKAVYETAMKRAHEFAWSNQWDRALKEYDRALAEQPDDRTAHKNKAQCLFRLHEWPQALAAYEALLRLDPGDLFAVNRLAEIYLALGQPDKARATYDRLADLYLQSNQFHEAIRALRDLSRALPKEWAVHSRLLELTTEVGDREGQIAEHLALSEIAMENSNLGEAQQHAEVAATLDPENAEVRRWGLIVRRRIAEAAGTTLLGSESDFNDKVPGAVGTSLLPAVPFETKETAGLIDEAMEAQNRGEFRHALELYDRAVRAGAQRPAVFYSAGLLNQQMGRPDFAIAYLERALQDREFAMSANYALGRSYSTMGDYPKAVIAFERALTLIDPATLTRNEADELIELYAAAADANVADNNPGRASSLYSTLVSMFKDKRWPHARLQELEAKANELYSASIQSKLMGISRGSRALDPVALPDGGSLEATRMMLDGDAALKGAHTEAFGQDPFSRAPASTEMPTTIMRSPGSSLRSITEYLRASTSSTEHDEEDEEREGTTLLKVDEGREAQAEDIFDAASLGAFALSGVEKQTIGVQFLIAEGENAMHEGKLTAAIDSCFAVIELESSYLPIHMMLGDIYLQQNKVDDAITKFQTVMDLYIARQDSASAAEVCQRMLLLQPENPALQTRLGVLYLEAGRIDEAAKALLGVADRYFQAGDVDRALEEAESLKVQMPNSSDVALHMGTYQMALGNSAEALAELSRALHLDPGNNVALVRLYMVLAQLNDDTQWDALQSIVERAPKDKAYHRVFMEEFHNALQKKPIPAVHYGMAVLAEQAGLTDIAADALDQGLLMMSLSPTGEISESWLLLEVLMCQSRGDLALNLKNGAVAAQHYGRALDVLRANGLLDAPTERRLTLQSPRPQYSFARLADPAQLYYGLAEAHAEQNNWDKALEALQALKGLMPNDYSVYTRLADIYFRQGLLGQALAELNGLLVMYQKGNDHERTLETLGHMARLAPNNVAVRRKLADMYLKLGMTEYGLAELNTLAELQLKAGLVKDAMSTYQKAADLHYTMSQHDKASSIYERIVRIAPRDIEARERLINTYIMSGRMADAVESERSLSELFIQEGRTEDAIGALHQLLALAPEDVAGHHSLAKQLTALGKYGEAARLYGRLVRLDPNNDRVPVLHTEMQRMAREAEIDATQETQKTGRSRKKADTSSGDSGKMSTAAVRG